MHSTLPHSVPAAATDGGPGSPRLCCDAGPASRVFLDHFSRAVPEAGWALPRRKIREGAWAELMDRQGTRGPSHCCTQGTDIGVTSEIAWDVWASVSPLSPPCPVHFQEKGLCSAGGKAELSNSASDSSQPISPSGTLALSAKRDPPHQWPTASPGTEPLSFAPVKPENGLSLSARTGKG